MVDGCSTFIVSVIVYLYYNQDYKLYTTLKHNQFVLLFLLIKVDQNFFPKCKI